MPASDRIANLTLQIDVGRDADADELDRATRQLRGEIQELGVESAELAKTANALAGTKSVEAVTLGALAISVLPTVVPKLIEFLQAWSMRGESRSIKIKTQVGDRAVEVEYSPKTMSQAELKSLVETLTSTLTDKSKPN
ncbi:MAG: hypothetical protein HY327_03235 [Chloroflexi bacterium]|nr:hypothetical protein [Chloroflexota bacterium]